MIEVNLLPGGKKKTARGGGIGMPSLNFAAVGAWFSARVKDKWLGATLLIAGISIGGIAYLYVQQQARDLLVNNRLEKVVADSTRYAVVLRDRIRAQAKRDSALLQLKVIQAIDEDRYIWPHVMDEVSRALPIYTWLNVMNISGTAQGVNPPAAIKAPPPDTSLAPRRRARPEVSIPRDTVRFRVVGRTVDIQALTRFMRSLEDSPFLGSVQMQKTETVLENGKDVTQFTLEVLYTRPDSVLIRRAPLTLTAR
jgi:Tfp pilus assembly protein PilN